MPRVVPSQVMGLLNRSFCKTLALHAPHDRYRLAARAIPNNGFVGSNRGPDTRLTEPLRSGFCCELPHSAGRLCDCVSHTHYHDE